MCWSNPSNERVRDVRKWMTTMTMTMTMMMAVMMVVVLET